MSNVRNEFIFLNRLRESGEVNMFGATPHLREEFDIGKREAGQVLAEWMAWVEEDPANRDK